MWVSKCARCRLVCPAMSQTDASTVASWMLEQFDRAGFLDQRWAAQAIADTFGPGFTYVSDSGNLAIDTKVLYVFRRLTEDSVVWSRSERHWRRRSPCDGSGRVCP